MSYHWNQSLTNKNPFSSPIISWRKEKQVNRTTERKQKRKQLLLYLLLPQHLEAEGPFQVFCGTLPEQGGHTVCSSSPRGGALSSVWGSIRRRWQAVKGVKTRHRLQPPPLPTQGGWSREEPGRGSQRVTAISPSQWITRKTPFISFFSSFWNNHPSLQIL